MCEAPCCATPQEALKLMDAGYGDRLMLDDWPDAETMLKPALKGHEGQKAPWETSTHEGCTFWKNGKCELHYTGLKPMHAVLAHHNLTKQEYTVISEKIIKSWDTKKGDKAIIRWKEERGMNE